MEPDRALGAYRQASAENAQPLPAHLGAATALITLKRFDEAIQEYEHFIVAEAPQFGPTLAKLLVLRNMRAEASSQDWERVERVLQDALKVEPQSSSVPLVRAQMWIVRNRPEQAREVLQVACKEHPRDAELWLALADTEMLRGHFERGLAVLKDAQDRYLGDCVELRLAQARYWERQYQNRPRDVSRALTDLENNLASFKPREQAHLLRDLGEIHYRLLHNDDAKRLWQHVAAMQPRDIQVRLVLFDIAIKARALAEAGDLVEQIRRIEGADGTQWRFAQASLLMASQQRDKSKADHDNLHYARQLLNEVAAKRSGWAATIRGLAALDDLEDNTQSALKRFAQAFDLGDRDPDALRRAIQLMYARRQYEDADRLLNELAKRGSLPVDLLSLEASLLSQQGEHARAIESARKAVRRGSKDLPDYIWLGQILQAGGEKYHQEAEAILRKATQLPGAENDPACWVALVHFLAATRQPDKAAAAVDVASRKLTSPTSDLALADCYEAIKQHQKARARLQAAFTRQPWDFDAVRSIATFYFRRHQLANAEPYFARLLDARVKAGEEERKWAFCFLTICRAHAGDFRAFEDVRIFLEKYLEANGSSAGNLRLQAMLLSAHPHYRKHALQILQDLRSRAVLTPEDQMSLGQLYEATAEWARAREIYGALARVELDSAEKQVLFIRNYVLALVRHQEPEVAANWLEALLQRDPDSEQTLSARVRVLKLQGQAAQAHALLQRYAQKPGVNPGVVAALFEESGQPAAALDFYRQAAKRAGNPGKLMLANFFIRQGHIEEALDLCDEAASAGLVEEAAALAVSALEMHGGASPLQFERVHKLLGDALLKQPASPALLTKMALLYNLQGNYTQAEALYRKVLQGDPNDLTALNNLAFLLTFKADRNWEMLNLLKRALDSAGPLPTLLDTRALVSLRLGNRAQALSDLDQAIADSPSAELYFHRARAQQALERDTAIASLKKARALNLTRNSLHPLERPSYDELLKTLGG
jgi:tetratricopeptide (TPR) repeat protein